MTKIFQITAADGFAIGPDFDTWEAARAYKNEHQIEGTIISGDDPTEPTSDPFAGNPEPQEMTAKWAREMQRSA
jgi:hypothetical protein